jgi:monoamine oxidase
VPNQETIDVAIIGAGMSGLAAADYINQGNADRAQAGLAPLRFVVLEGSERAGGRTRTEGEAPGFLELGGQYVAPTQTYTQLMLARFGLETFETFLPDDLTSLYEPATGDTIQFHGNYPLTPRLLEAIGGIEAAILPIRAHLERPWECHRARELDQVSVEDFMRQSLADKDPSDEESAYCRELLSIAVRSAFSVEPREMSWFYFLYYGATCGSMQAFENVKGGGDALRIAYGTQALVKALLNAVGAANVRYQCKVSSVQHDASGVTVTYTNEDGEEASIRAQRSIVALSPKIAGKIAFKTPLHEHRRALADGAPMAATIKSFLRFDTAWWRKNFTGYALSAKGPADWIMDNTWKDPADDLWKYPALMTFIVGDRARELTKLAAEERRELLLEQIYRLFGGQKADFPCVGYVEHDWLQDPWSGGCPAGCFKPGVLTSHGQGLRTPVGKIHWAGSETATDWMGGYMNGAIQAGIRAASEVLAAEAPATAQTVARRG